MEQLINNNDYPANILSAVFGTCGDEYFYYCEKEQLEQTVNEIMQLNFTAEDSTVLFSLYRERKSMSDIASELQCSEETVSYMHSRILRQLRHPKVSKLLKGFTYAVKVVQSDGRLVNELVKIDMIDNEPIAIAENGEAVAFMINPELYNTLNQKALLIDKIVKITKEQYDKFYGSL